MNTPALHRAAAILIAVGTVAGCTTSGSTRQSSAGSAVTPSMSSSVAAACRPVASKEPVLAAKAARTDGPHSPAGRKAAPAQVQCPTGATVLDVDLGDVDLGGGFRAPVRGVLVLPRTARKAPLVIMSHLRSPGCANDELSYPCTGGKERRLDRGMTHLGVDLARGGYATLIPDLAPLWIGQEMSEPYDQFAGWEKVVGTMRDRLIRSVQGKERAFGMPITGRIDTARAGLIVHSRSGYIAGPAVTKWAKGPMKITTVMGYGAAYDAEVGAPVTPMIPDVPYLGVVGPDDQDVGFKTFRWMDAHLATKRNSPALVAKVDGFGHNFINRTLSAAKIDDRTGCTGPCRSAAEHEQFLGRTVRAWFDRTLRDGKGSEFPMAPSGALPASLAGVPTTWSALTNHRLATVLDSSAPKGVQATGGAPMKVCRFFEPMDPNQAPDRCPEPETGVVTTAGQVVTTTLGKAAGVRIAGTRVAGARTLVLQIAPFGDRADKAAASPVRATVSLADGSSVVVDAPADSAALRNRASSASAGTYPISTVRIPLPDKVTRSKVVSVTLTSRSATQSAVVLRAIDLA